MSETEVRRTLGEQAARQLANTSKTRPQLRTITPRWLTAWLPWEPVEAGTYRVNKVVVPYEETHADVQCPGWDDVELPEIFVDYEEKPREFTLNALTTVVDVQTRVSDLYRSPYDQIREQLRLVVEKVKERQEYELLHSPDYGLLSQIDPAQRVAPRTGPPTPDDLDELIALVWKEPAFFLAHPRTIAAFGRECTLRGVPPPTITAFGAPFLTWRGIPLVPTNKLSAANDRSSILLLRTGEKKQGVIGLFQPGLPGEVQPSLSVRFMGIDRRAVASYLISLYCSVAVLTEDAIGILEDVNVANYPEYSNRK
jgi:hypothetical protein